MSKSVDAIAAQKGKVRGCRDLGNGKTGVHSAVESGEETLGLLVCES